MEDLKTLDIARETLKEEVEKFQILKQNLETQINSLKIQLEAKERIQKAEMQNQIYAEEKRLQALADNIKEREYTVEQSELKLQDRIRMLEHREQEMVDIEEKRTALNKERSNFNMYRFNVERELEKAKITIEEAKEKDNEIKTRIDSLKAREIGIEKKEKYWNDVIGKLEQDKKAFEIERENALKPVEA